MQSQPDLSQLSPAQKDELIRMLWPLQQQVQDLMAQMVVMQERIKYLEGRLAFRFVGCPTAAALQCHPDDSQGRASYKPRGRKPRGAQTLRVQILRSCGYGDLRLPGVGTKSAYAMLLVGDA